MASTALLAGCGGGGNGDTPRQGGIVFDLTAAVQSAELPEISGMESRDGPQYIVHNDDGAAELFVLDAGGAVHARYRIRGASNRDWEDIAWLEAGGQAVLAVGDIGDNLARRTSIRIYFVDLPPPDAAPSPGPVEIDARHALELTYPDGPRDCEALAYDPTGRRLLLLTKRDKPPRLYGVDAERALKADSLVLEFLGESSTFRPPTRTDHRSLGEDAAWISQPTGMDINAAGTLAAVITYRSLYLFKRAPGQSWPEAFLQPPREFLGPPTLGEEAVAFTPDMGALVISSEGHPAPIYRARLPAPSQ